MLPLIAAQMNSVWIRKPTFLQNVSHESCECNATVPARFAKTYEDNLLALGAICDELLQLLLHAREQRGVVRFVEQRLHNVDVLASVASVRWIVERETIDPHIDSANEGRLLHVDFLLQRRQVSIVWNGLTQICQAELDNTSRCNLNFEATRHSRPSLCWQRRWNTCDT